MRITLNLAAAASARDRYALFWALPATLLGTAALVLFGRVLLREYREYRGVQLQVAEVQKHIDELRDQERSIRKKLDDPAYRDLLRRAKFVNSLIEQRQVTLTELTARLAGLMPEDARLTGLSLSEPTSKTEEYQVRMGITAKSEDSIEDFLNDMEDDPAFKDVSIINQGFLEESSQAGQVNIICMADYLPQARQGSDEAPPGAK